MYASRQEVDIGGTEQKSRNTSINMQHFLCTPNTPNGAIIQISDPICSSCLSKHRSATEEL